MQHLGPGFHLHRSHCQWGARTSPLFPHHPSRPFFTPSCRLHHVEAGPLCSSGPAPHPRRAALRAAQPGLCQAKKRRVWAGWMGGVKWNGRDRPAAKKLSRRQVPKSAPFLRGCFVLPKLQLSDQELNSSEGALYIAECDILWCTKLPSSCRLFRIRQGASKVGAPTWELKAVRGARPGPSVASVRWLIRRRNSVVQEDALDSGDGLIGFGNPDDRGFGVWRVQGSGVTCRCHGDVIVLLGHRSDSPSREATAADVDRVRCPNSIRGCFPESYKHGKLPESTKRACIKIGRPPCSTPWQIEEKSTQKKGHEIFL